MSQSTMCRCCQRLGEDVGRVLVALDVEQLEVLLGDPVSNHVELKRLEDSGRESPPGRR